MINLSMAEPDNMLRPRITVFGVGGGGGNAINNMIRSNLDGCEFVVANTDSQALAQSLASRKIQLGTNLSRGLGAGSKPDVGCAAAEESWGEIMSILEGSDMLFVTAGMGGGTGTGAAPVIARAARENGILTVGVVTKPFHFEGTHRMRQAERGIAELQQYVDTLIVIPNQNLFRIANERTTFAEAFRMADEVLHAGVRGITDLMVMPGFMNLDFADVKTVMGEMGKAMMGTGEAEGDNRAICAAEAAISNPLLDDISMKGARGVLINITGGLDMTLFEVDQAANRIREEVDPDAQIKVGSTLGDGLDGRIRVSVIATGIDMDQEHTNAQTVGAVSATSSMTRTASQSTRTTPTPKAYSYTPPQERPAASVSSIKQPALSAQKAESKPSVAPVEEKIKEEDEATPTISATTTATATAKPSSSLNVSSSFFTMPAAITPKMMTGYPAVTAPNPTAVDKPAPTVEKKPAAPQARVVETQQSETPVKRTVARDDEFAFEEEPAQRDWEASSRSKTSPLPPVREIPPVQQAARQRTAPATNKPEPMGNDMRMTQLTTQDTPPAPASISLNQRAQSLFQRITGFGLIRPSAAEKEMEEEMAQEDNKVEEAPKVESASRTNPRHEDDSDLLDIPAFLRRQSNH